MPPAKSKSELEKYLDSLVVSLRIQSAKRPESWIRWGGIVVAAGLTKQFGYALLVGVCSGAIAEFLTVKRLGARSWFEYVARTSESRVPFAMRGLSRKGRLEEKLGAETVAILESISRAANAVIATVVKAQMLDGGGLAMTKHFRPLTEAMETLTIAALVAAYQPVQVKQMPDEETCAKLREYESGVVDLLAQAKEIAKEIAPSEGISEEANRVMQEVQARKELRESEDLRDGA